MKNINFCKNIESRKLIVYGVSQKKIGLNFKRVIANINIGEKSAYKILYFTATSIVQKNEEFYIIEEKNQKMSIGNKLITHFIENENIFELLDINLFITRILRNDNLGYRFEMDLC